VRESSEVSMVIQKRRGRSTAVPESLGRAPALEAAVRSRRVPCAKSVPESDVLMPLGLALSEKQIPQIIENTEKPK
jgi:hypothetical protein